MAVTLTGGRRGLCGLATALALCAPLLGPSAVLALGAAAPFAPPARIVVKPAPPAPALAPAAAAAAAATAATLPQAAAASEPEATPVAAVAGSGLSGIHLGTPPRALIDGEWVALGERVRGARLDAVRAAEVHLRHPDGRIERLPLTPQVQLLFSPRPPPSPPVSRWPSALPARPQPESP